MLEFLNKFGPALSLGLTFWFACYLSWDWKSWYPILIYFILVATCYVVCEDLGLFDEETKND
jgi:hypothetical protein